MTYYLKNTTGGDIVVRDMGRVLPPNSEIPLDSNSINGWLTEDLKTEIQSSNLVLSTTNLSDTSGDMSPSVALNALSITSRFDTDNPHNVTISQAIGADGGTDITPDELETLTDDSDASLLHHHDSRYYTITQLSNSNPSSVDVHWDNIIDTPNFGSFEWRAPVRARIEGQYSNAPSGSDGQYYLDTDDQHLYRHDGSEWIDQGVPVEEDRFIDKSNQNIYEYDGTAWNPQAPGEGWSVLVEDDGDKRPAQYIYSDISGTLKWTKIADIDWGTHNEIGGRSESGAHPSLAIKYNNTLSSYNFVSETVQEVLDEINDLISYADKEVYVNINRDDDYVETGSDDKPFKTISSAVNKLGNSGIIHLLPGTYTENFNLPGNFELKGSGADMTIIEGDFTLGDGTPRGNCSMEDIFLKNQMTIDISSDKKLEINRCQSTGSVILSSGKVVAESFPIKPSSSDVTALDVSSQGQYSSSNSSIISTGNIPTIDSRGTITLNATEVQGSSNTPVIQSTDGKVRLNFASVRNLNSGLSVQLDNPATTSNPNYLQGVSHNSGIELNDSVTVVEGVYGTLPSGTNIIFRPSRQISYDNSASGLSAENVQDAIDEIAAESGTEVDGIIFVAKNGVDVNDDVVLGSLDNPYLTIQAGIDAAVNKGGDHIIVVFPGTYNENINIPSNIGIYGFSKNPIKIGTNNSSNTHTLDFGSGGNMFFQNIDLREDSINVLHTAGSTGGAKLEFLESKIGNIVFNGLGSIDTLTIKDSFVRDYVSIHAANFEIVDSIINGENTTIGLSVNDDGSENTHTNGYKSIGYIKGSKINYGLSIEDNVFSLLNSSRVEGAIAADGSNSKIVYDVISVSRTSSINLLNGATGERDSQALHLYFDSTQNPLESKNVQHAIEEILKTKIKGVIFVSKDGSDSSPDPSYLGNMITPFASIQAAVNRIEQEGDNSMSIPYVVYVSPGVYNENVLLNDSLYKNFVIMGSDEGNTYIRPTSDSALESSGQNADFTKLKIKNITIDGDVIFKGVADQNSTFVSGLELEDVVINGNLDLQYFHKFYSSDSTFNGNVFIDNVSNAHFKSCFQNDDHLFTIQTDTSSNQPIDFTNTFVKICDSEIFSELEVDSLSVLETCSGTKLGNGVRLITISGTLESYDSWIKPSSLSISPSGIFKTYGTFFDKSIMNLQGSFDNNTKSDVVYYDDTVSELVADNVQDAIDNLKALYDAFIVPKGSVFPPSPEEAQLFHRTDIGLTFQFDEERDKWMSITQMFLDWGANAADGKYLNIHGATATQTGYLMPYDGTVVSVTARIASGNQSKSFEIRRNHDATSPLYTFSTTSGEFREIDPSIMNIDFDAGDYIQAYASSTGTPARDVVIMAVVVWRAS